MWAPTPRNWVISTSFISCQSSCEKSTTQTRWQNPNSGRARGKLEGPRANGNVRQGVRVAGEVVAKFEHIEPRGANLPDWLDMTVPNDRLVASALLNTAQQVGGALGLAILSTIATSASNHRLPDAATTLYRGLAPPQR